MITDVSTVFVVDDDAACRKALTLLTESVQLPVQSFGSALEFIERVSKSRPGCLLLDLRMPGMGGLELQSRLRADGYTLPIIFITGHGDVQAAVRALRDGAVDLIEKPYSPELLLERVRDALQVDRVLRARLARLERIQTQLDQLTAREREVLELIVAGDANKEMAVKLGVSIKTIEAHRARVMEKMGAKSLAELVQSVLVAQSAASGAPA